MSNSTSSSSEEETVGGHMAEFAHRLLEQFAQGEPGDHDPTPVEVYVHPVGLNSDYHTTVSFIATAPNDVTRVEFGLPASEDANRALHKVKKFRPSVGATFFDMHGPARQTASAHAALHGLVPWDQEIARLDTLEANAATPENKKRYKNIRVYWTSMRRLVGRVLTEASVRPQVANAVVTNVVALNLPASVVSSNRQLRSSMDPRASSPKASSKFTSNRSRRAQRRTSTASRSPRNMRSKRSRRRRRTTSSDPGPKTR